jgi:hypothetical protein
LTAGFAAKKIPADAPGFFDGSDCREVRAINRAG